MKTELEIITELATKLRATEKEVQRLTKMIEMLCQGYTFVKHQLPASKKQ